jgi:hypothetical protein
MPREPLPKALYSVEDLTPANIKVVNADTYKAVTGLSKQVMNFNRDPKSWLDIAVRSNPASYPRRVMYDNVLELNDLGAVVWEQVDNLPTPKTPQEMLALEFYKAYSVKKIPKTTFLQIPKEEAAESNFATSDEVIPNDWSLRPFVPVPFFPLVAGEAWFPDESGLHRHKLAIVNISMWRTFAPATNSPVVTVDLKAHMDARFDELVGLIKGTSK